MTSAYDTKHFWAVSLDGKVRILVGSQDEWKARDEACAIWPGCTWLGAIAEFIRTPDRYFVYNEAEFVEER